MPIRTNEIAIEGTPNDIMMSLPTLAPSVILSVILFLHIGSPAFGQPSISEPSLTAELVLDGLLSPTSINENNILLLEKEGRVRLISNGQLQTQPVLQLAGVESNNKRGLLGIEVMDNNHVQFHYVLFFLLLRSYFLMFFIPMIDKIINYWLKIAST